jgi:hypothetical protein
MNNPLPIARQIPTILNAELLFLLTSPAAELEAAAAEEVELATVLDMARIECGRDWRDGRGAQIEMDHRHLGARLGRSEGQ